MNILAFLEVTEAYLKVFTGSVLSFLITLTGMGGGIFYIPIVKIFFDLETSIVIGTVSLAVLFTRIFGFIWYAKHKRVEYSKSLLFLYGAVPGTLLSSSMVNMALARLSGKNLQIFQSFLTYFVAVIILLSLGFMSAQRSFYMTKFKRKHSRQANKAFLALSGLISGLAMGLSGVGGGVLIIPALSMFTRLSMKIIIGSSIFIGTIIFILTSFIYSLGGQVDYATAFFLALGSGIGVPLAGRMVLSASDKSLRRLLILCILGAVIFMIIQETF